MSTPPISYPPGVDPVAASQALREAQLAEVRENAERQKQIAETEARKQRWADSLKPPPIPDVLPEAAKFDEVDDGIDRREEAREYLAKLRAHRSIIEGYGKAGLAIYGNVERILRLNQYTTARRAGYRDSELFGLIAGGPAHARRIEAVGLVAKLPADASIKAFDASRVRYEVTSRDGVTRQAEMPRSATQTYTNLLMPWELPGSLPSRDIPGLPSADQVSRYDAALVERDALLATLQGQPATWPHDTCSTCQHFAAAGRLGFCRAGKPDPANARALAERLGVPLGSLTLDAQWPLTRPESGCGEHFRRYDLETK